MARTRTIDQNAILDAVDAVVQRQGVTELTIDAVAKEAGISKASVIYDYKSKDGLISAFVKRQIDREREKVARRVAEGGEETNAFILSLLALDDSKPAGPNGGTVRCFVAAMKSGTEMHDMLRQAVSEDIDTIRETSTRPASAIIAYLAWHGLKSLDYLNLYEFDATERARILRQLATFLTEGVGPDPDPDSET